jgi:glutaredoxin-like YruB-family protein
MKTVKIYTTPTCHYCKMAKAFFNEHNVAYEEHDVQADLTARQEMLTKSGQMGVPVITVDSDLVVGFDEERLTALLGV